MELGQFLKLAFDQADRFPQKGAVKAKARPSRLEKFRQRDRLTQFESAVVQFYGVNLVFQGVSPDLDRPQLGHAVFHRE